MERYSGIRNANVYLVINKDEGFSEILWIWELRQICKDKDVTDVG